MNNYQKIKAMSIDEMAELLISECQLCPRANWNDCIKSCLNDKKQWLESEEE